MHHKSWWKIACSFLLCAVPSLFCSLLVTNVFGAHWVGMQLFNVTVVNCHCDSRQIECDGGVRHMHNSHNLKEVMQNKK